MTTPTLEQIVIVLSLAAAPISELRGAIPVAILSYDFSPYLAYGLAVLGNLVPVIAILLLLDPVVKLLGNIKFFERIFDWVFGYTRKRHSDKVERWGLAALVLIVAIPLPMTGAWSGSLVAFLFGIPFRKAFPMIAAGVLIAGILVTLGTLGLIQIF